MSIQRIALFLRSATATKKLYACVCNMHACIVYGLEQHTISSFRSQHSNLCGTDPNPIIFLIISYFRRFGPHGDTAWTVTSVMRRKRKYVCCDPFARIRIVHEKWAMKRNWSFYNGWHWLNEKSIFWLKWIIFGENSKWYRSHMEMMYIKYRCIHTQTRPHL